METPSSGLSFLDRADEHLDKISDPVLLLLKGHLIVEESLRSLVASNVKNPKFLKQANLSFYQILNIAKAMFFDLANEPTDMTKVWDAFVALNSIRNALAHELEPKDISPLLRRFFVIWPGQPQSLNDKAIIVPINMALGALLGTLRVIELRCQQAHEKQAKISG